MYFCHGLAICCCYHGSAGLGTTGENVRINTFGVFILGAAVCIPLATLPHSLRSPDNTKLSLEQLELAFSRYILGKNEPFCAVFRGP